MLPGGIGVAQPHPALIRPQPSTQFQPTWTNINAAALAQQGLPPDVLFRKTGSGNVAIVTKSAASEQQDIFLAAQQFAAQQRGARDRLLANNRQVDNQKTGALIGAALGLTAGALLGGVGGGGVGLGVGGALGGLIGGLF